MFLLQNENTMSIMVLNNLTNLLTSVRRFVKMSNVCFGRVVMKEFNAEKFCKDLITLRAKESQTTFAEKLNLKRSTLSLLENGKQMPTIDILSRICNLSGKSADEYFVESTSDALVYLMGSLEECDKVKIEEMAERIRIKEKYELLAKRGSYVVD